MREQQAFGAQAVAKAVRDAAAAEGDDPLVVVSDDGLNVRRARALIPGVSTDVWSRSAYVKGFGEDDSDANEQEKVETYFDQFGRINAVRKRRSDAEKKDDKGRRANLFKVG